LRLITWNVARRTSRLVEQATALATRECDVVALQEVTRRTLPLWRSAFELMGLVDVRASLDNGVVKIDSLSAIRCLAAAAPASRILCGDLNTPRRELPDGGVLSFARDSRGRLRLYALPSAGLSVSPRLARERPE
jgi:endonuclease/exonuclease/phosphatase family metal-dependent hydrolase